MSADQSDLVTYDELVVEFRRCCVEKRTGTVLIATEDNHLARILFENGEITFLAHGLKSGRDAIPLIKKIGRTRVKFSHGRVGGHQTAGSLPSTAEIMSQLAGGNAPAPTAAVTSLGADQVPNALKVIEAELVEVLGPLANLVWTEHLERIGKPVAARKLPMLVDSLAKEIDDPTKIQKFKDQVWQKLGSSKNHVEN